jgi:hypothetical protein
MQTPDTESAQTSKAPQYMRASMAEVEQEETPREAGWGLVLLWVGAAMVAALVNWGIWTPVSTYLISSMQRDNFSVLSWQWMAANMGLGLVGSVVIGVLQWLVLRRCIEGIAWWTWTLAVAVGNLIAYPCETGISVAAGFLIPIASAAAGWPGAMLPVVAGQLVAALIVSPFGAALQWIILQRHLRSTAVWVVAVVASHVLGVSVYVIPLLSSLSGGPQGDTSVSSLVSYLVATPAIASITGITLLWLVNNTRRTNWTYETP